MGQEEEQVMGRKKRARREDMDERERERKRERERGQRRTGVGWTRKRPVTREIDVTVTVRELS